MQKNYFEQNIEKPYSEFKKQRPNFELTPIKMGKKSSMAARVDPAAINMYAGGNQKSLHQHYSQSVLKREFSGDQPSVISSKFNHNNETIEGIEQLKHFEVSLHFSVLISSF